MLEPLEIMGDSLALRKALNFILENALESVTKKRPGTIHLTAEEDDGALVITIGDNGIGMNAEQLTKAFIPLYTTKPGQMGMGLPIARKLLGEMGGRMDIESTPGEGTRVHIWLPKNSNAAAVG
jgi:signal transduction histidine kinase